MVLSTLPADPVVAPPIPARLEGLKRLAYNLYWTWHPRVISLFKRIDAHTWSQARNPVPVLRAKTDWSDLLDNPEFLTEYGLVLKDFDEYMAAAWDVAVAENDDDNWFSRLRQHAPAKAEAFEKPIAYFCAEFGLHEHLQIYSGGLGVLAGDHLKTASDMNLPLVAIGLLYRQGYFRQAIDAEGLQEHGYPHVEPEHMPLLRVQDPKTGRPLQVYVELPGRKVQIAVWVARVGRVPLLLLDTDIADNAAADRPITSQLYVRGREMRLHQELILGVGGARALKALSIEPSAWHLNEGHSAFMIVERLRDQMKAGKPFNQALEEIRKNAVFTIHTPVSAGNEKFDANLVRRLTAPLFVNTGMDVERVLELGRGEHADPNVFDMTAFSLRMSSVSNAVSQLHAATANSTWKHIMGGREILGVTNGVHMGSWLGPRLRWLAEDVDVNLEDLGKEQASGALPKMVHDLDDNKLWDGHQRQKTELFYFMRNRLRKQLARHGEGPDTLGDVDKFFDPTTLTLGFARRFATYKRAHLLFTDEERLARILWNKERPVNIVFAGKAHPADRPGQKVIADLWQKSRHDRFRGRVFVIEDYDMRVGRFLVDGVDVWLNNPRRPLEASGTSGMKAAANGIPNLSILDGWWDEGFDGGNGWAIGNRDQNADDNLQDTADALSLYETLEREVVPTYYDRDHQGLPARWIVKMRAAMSSAIWKFSTHRMLEEYVERSYLPAARRR
ncbi:MAG: alpha-glucan family phosphorylase [Deltaproteobacteria bacterium]|nr:alpha-glucan family phosphorylase [Deltaproteobacteria bacterium]